MLTLENITKRRGNRVILSDVTFRAGPGRVTALLGPNGAGKSSSLRILLGLDRPTSGTALVDGRPYASLRAPLHTVGALLDGASAVPERRGVDHLRWLAHSHRLPARHVDEALATVGLTDAARRRVGRYSLGMRQRLGLAAALLGRQRALVLDEPVNGLDPEGIRTVRTYLRDYAAQGNTVLVSSHLMNEVEEVADDVVIIDRGQVIADGPLAEVSAGHGSLEEAFFALTGGSSGRKW
ncbi:ATP-binding cassette domain-containing protein [Nocardiopsis sp. NPDC007018]|uniref:ABC transporter ATP-binding protein n=1 Tax=Nocardiopsis sp. NPDC007018 TaxID=3155721 RepID=UPI0034056927